jgi:large subunit ribosomal protein L9
MPKTEVILLENIVGLGGESDQIKVAAGYARNYLFPQRLAIPSNLAHKKQVEALRRRRAEREAHEFNTMSDMARSLSKLTCVVKVKTGDDGKMFGAVTTGSIADELKQQFDIALDKKKIHLEQPIRSLGEYEVELRLHSDVKTNLKLRVESTTPPPAPTEAATEAAKGKEAGRDERGAGRGERGRPRGPRPDRPAGKPGKPEATAKPPGKEDRPPRAARPPHPDRPAKSAKPEAPEPPK